MKIGKLAPFFYSHIQFFVLRGDPNGLTLHRVRLGTDDLCPRINVNAIEN